MDIDTAFLNGVLSERIGIKLPDGFLDYVSSLGADASKLGLPNDNLSDLSLELIKSLYGLKQAPREWHKVLVEFLNSIGFEKSLSESCIYVRKVKDQMAIVAIYVDDLVLLAKNDDTMEALKAQVKARFACKDMGPIHFILGLRIQRDEGTMTMKIDQRLNALNMLRRFGLDKCHPADTPMKAPLSSADCPPDGAPKDDDLHSKYRQGVGCLMYLMIGTRPDIAYAVQALSRHLNNPGVVHYEAMKRTMRSTVLSAFSDADYATDSATRRSVTGHCTFIGANLVSWCSNSQRIVATSTTKAEYIALAQATREVLFQRSLHRQRGNRQNQATVLYGDNQPAIAVATNPVHHARTKHIDVRYHFIRERIQLQDIRLEYVASEDNVADAFTKPLHRSQFQHLRDRLGVQVGKTTWSNSAQCVQV
ncbi:hypothetical protein LEN26_006155 [Aphanomyces euteiches]|nr:hypothetical protein LEN26_006155 [Aphanomyces euteiches]